MSEPMAEVEPIGDTIRDVLLDPWVPVLFALSVLFLHVVRGEPLVMSLVLGVLSPLSFAVVGVYLNDR